MLDIHCFSFGFLSKLFTCAFSEFGNYTGGVAPSRFRSACEIVLAYGLVNIAVCKKIETFGNYFIKLYKETDGLKDNG